LFTSFPCQSQPTHRQSAIGAVNISYAHEASSNIQIFESPDLARHVFEQDRNEGDLDILGHPQPTTDVGDSGYGLKKIGSSSQNNLGLVDYDFVRSCYIVSLNNAVGNILSHDSSSEYSSESQEFAAKFAKQLDQKLKQTSCGSGALSQKSDVTPRAENRPAPSKSFPINDIKIICSVLVLALVILIAKKLLQKVPSASANPAGTEGSKVASHRTALNWALVFLGGLSLLIIGYLEISGRSAAYYSLPSELPARSRMALTLERTGNAWRFSWDPDAPIIRRATKGRLLITDGSSQKTLDLDASDLLGGTIIYTPSTNDVILRLEVSTADSGEIISESVRTVGAEMSSSAHSSPSARTVSGAKASQAEGLSVDATADPIRVRKDLTPNTDVAAPMKTAASSQDESTKIPADEKQLTTSVNAPLPESVAHAFTIPEAESASKLHPETVDSVPAASTAALRRTTDLQPAELISRSEPYYPSILGRFSGSVEVRFRIRTDGTVHDVRVVNGNLILARAAVEAVQRWRYKSARLNGNSIETDGNAIFQFK